jgi:hypothetical protein
MDNGEVIPIAEAREHVRLARQLTDRLERLSVDSHWAHLASGVRRSIIRSADEVEDQDPPDPASVQRLIRLMGSGFEIVENGAREIGPRDG